MSQDNHSQLAMYINMRPCSYKDGCDNNLKAIIPEGRTLYVHQVKKNGSTRLWKYDGTGEALKKDDDHG